MKILKTISKRELKITSNQSKRHHTIETESGKYRTTPMSQEEFESNEFNTGNDWQQFLNRSDGSYHKVK